MNPKAAGCGTAASSSSSSAKSIDGVAAGGLKSVWWGCAKLGSDEVVVSGPARLDLRRDPPLVDPCEV